MFASCWTRTALSILLSIPCLFALQPNYALQNLLERRRSPDLICSDSLKGPIETTECDYEAIDNVHNDLYQQLHELIQTPFFRFFRVDLYRECPFWAENGFCTNKECGITTVDESEIPEKWRAEALSKVELPSEEQRNSLPGCYYRDSDFCFLDDMTEGDYVDLVVNPERFTGYIGEAAHRVWRAIYQENCFGLSELSWASQQSRNTIPHTFAKPRLESDPLCLEKRVYYRIISGLHASITTHICRENFNQSTLEWAPSLECFEQRVASNPERLQHIYFNTVLLLRAVSRLGPYLTAYDYCSTGTREEDVYTRNKLYNVIEIARIVGRFNETTLFRGGNSHILREEFKQHFRNVSRIMDCVGCDKCRLWGKVQTTGLATALKVLFELDEAALDPSINSNLLSRSEVVALINTLHRFSESLGAIHVFRDLWVKQRGYEAKTDRSLPSPSVRASGNLHASSVFQGLKYQLVCLFRLCKTGTKDCAMIVVSTFWKIVRSCSSLSEPSGKGEGPHSEL